MKIREISCKLRLSRNTVRSIIKRKGVVPGCTRKDKIEIDSELFTRLYGEKTAEPETGEPVKAKKSKPIARPETWDPLQGDH